MWLGRAVHHQDDMFGNPSAVDCEGRCCVDSGSVDAEHDVCATAEVDECWQRRSRDEWLVRQP